jgi:hypothetical protein
MTIKGPSEEFEDFDAIKRDVENNVDFDEINDFEEDDDLSNYPQDLEVSDDLLNGHSDPAGESNGDNFEADETDADKKSFLKKNKGLLIFMGLGSTIVFGAMFALMPSMSIQPKPTRITSNFADKTIGANQQSPFIVQTKNPIKQGSVTPIPEPQPAQTTIIKGLSEEDVLNLVEPMGIQINGLIDAITNQNEYIQSLPTVVNESPTTLSEENLSVIKWAIDEGLKRTEGTFKDENAILLEKIDALSKRLSKLESNNVAVVKRRMTMVTSIEGKVRVEIDGTNEVQEIINGSILRGYGKVRRVGPWGCLYFENGTTYEPSRASCSAD